MLKICNQFSWLHSVTDSSLTGVQFVPHLDSSSFLEVSSVKLSQQFENPFLLPLLGAMLAENFDLRSSLLPLGSAQASLALLSLTRSLAHLPDDSAVFHHPIVATLEHRSQIDHILRLNRHQLVIERPGRAKEVVIDIIEPEHMQLIKHSVRIRAAVKHAPDDLRVWRYLGKLLYELTFVFFLLARHSLSELSLCSCFVRQFLCGHMALV